MQRGCYSFHPHIVIENLNIVNKKNKFITLRHEFLDTRSGRDWILSLWRDQMSHKAVVRGGQFWRWIILAVLLFSLSFVCFSMRYSLISTSQPVTSWDHWMMLPNPRQQVVGSVRVRACLALGWEGSLTLKALCQKLVLDIFLKLFGWTTRKGFEKLNDIYQW